MGKKFSGKRPQNQPMFTRPDELDFEKRRLMIPIMQGSPPPHPSLQQGDYGLSFVGTVTTYTDTTHFASTSVAGKGDGYFIGYYVYVVWDAGGAGAAPQGEWQLISGYTSATGAFTHTALSTSLAVGDKVLIQHPNIDTIPVDGVYVDSGVGVSGTTWPIGTPMLPVSNLANAFTIAAARKLRLFYILHGDFSIPSNITDYIFIGLNEESEIDLNSKQTATCTFKNLSISGANIAGSDIFLRDCRITGTTTIFNGPSTRMENIICNSILRVGADAADILIDGGVFVPGSYLDYYDFETDCELNNISGIVTIKKMSDAASSLYIYGHSLHVTIQSTCTAGDIYIYGDVLITNQGTATVHDYSTHKAGRIATLTKNITSAANAGDVTVATVTSGTCLIKSVILRSNAATTADLTSAGIFGGASKVITFLSATDAVKANLDADDEQVSWTGAVTLETTKTIVISLVGTGATAVDFDVDIEYEAITGTAYLA